MISETVRARRNPIRLAPLIAIGRANRYPSPPMLPRSLLALAAFAGLSAPVFAESKFETHTDPSTAGPDFAVQGEYVGENSAAQVIALGGGAFRVVGWANGLPGAADDAEKKVEVDARRADGKVAFDGEGWKGAIEGDTLTGTNEEGNTWKLKKTERKSPTLGAKPPAGAVVLFDGTSADAWHNGKIVEGDLLNCGVKSKQSFGDFTLHLEFRTPFMPSARGQARGNSGCYIQDRYECQVLDSFGLKGENNECGGIYTIAKPRVNMCLPPLSWQTYDIDFEAAKFDAEGKKTKNAIITVKHNGVLIHDKLELPKTTGGAGLKESPEPGPIQLQQHGNPVVYRNIWVVEKK